MNHIKIPSSNCNRIIIPSNPVGNAFKRNCYNKEHLKGLINEKEFVDVVNDISRLA